MMRLTGPVLVGDFDLCIKQPLGTLARFLASPVSCSARVVSCNSPQYYIHPQSLGPGGGFHSHGIPAPLWYPHRGFWCPSSQLEAIPSFLLIIDRSPRCNSLIIHALTDHEAMIVTLFRIPRLMSHYIHIHVLDPSRLPPLLRAIRAALFPNNAPGVSSLKPPSSGEELAALRRRCASAFWGLVPRAVGELYYGTDNWAWFGVKANTITNEGVNLIRTDPLKTSSSTFKLNHATNLKGGTDAGPSHISPADENNPMMRSDATLCSRSKPSEPGETLPKQDKEDEARRLSEIEAGIVDIFSDAYFNKHLIYGILELVLVRLVPELAEKGVGELWEERLH
ncbi:hypothetical protein F5B21DRAFT_18817 [Xylaria acuta]|nr:hypothetical protein F5B21DRAFT_18817 [Xylaria acuta]